MNIIELSESKLGLTDEEIEVEYQGETIGKYGMDYNGNNFLLVSKTTDCLAKDKCGIPEEKRIRWLSKAIQLDFITHAGRADSLTSVFESTAAHIAPDLVQDCREQIQMIIASEGDDAASMAWAQRILDYAERNDHTAMALAQLRMANAAQRLHRPLEVIIALHEAVVWKLLRTIERREACRIGQFVEVEDSPAQNRAQTPASSRPYESCSARHNNAHLSPP